MKMTPISILRAGLGICILLMLVTAFLKYSDDSNMYPTMTREPPVLPHPKELVPTLDLWTQSPTKRLADCDDSPEKQLDREGVIERLIEGGICTTVQWSDSAPEVWVTMFLTIQPEETQNTLLGVIYSYWNCEREDFGRSGSSWDPLIIKMEYRTPSGIIVGEYTPIRGVQWVEPRIKRDPDCNDPARQTDSEKVMRTAIAGGWWTRVEWSGSSPRVWVTRKFLDRPATDSPQQFEAFQNLLLGSAWIYWNCEREVFGWLDPLVIVTDDGSRLGNYTLASGVNWD